MNNNIFITICAAGVSGGKEIIMKKKEIRMLLIMGIITVVLTGCGSSKAYSDYIARNSAALTTEEAASEEGATDNSAPLMQGIQGDNSAGSMEKNLYEGESSEDSIYIDDQAEANGYIESCYAYEYKEIESGYPNTEEYSDIPESAFSSVMKEPLSTFSADVDTASYSNLRRMIRDGYGMDDIPDGAVRIEEMLNYFSYNYKTPDRNEPFGVTTEISTCPWNADRELLMIGLKTEDIDYADAPPSNLVFLIDVSGSMYDEDKLPLLQKSFALLAENLSEKDRVSIVTYAGSDQIVLKGVEGNKTNTIVNALMNLEAGGSTFGSKGITTAYALAEDCFIKGGNNRVILATDGDLNVGLTSESELEELISEKKESGVYLSVLGFGTGNIKDNKMETLADKGNGNYSYIDSLKEAEKVLVKEMGATLLTICKDVKFQVEFNPLVVKEYRLIGYENRRMEKEDFNDDQKDAGEVGAGHSVTALYEIILRDSLSDSRIKETSGLKYADSHKEGQGTNDKGKRAESSAISNEWLTISIKYKKPAEDKSSLLEYPVDYESYVNLPSEDWQFAAAVAEFGLLVTDSENQGDASIKNVTSTLKKLKFDDEYKEEFHELVKQIQKN